MPNAKLFARALFALHEVKVLDDPACKGAVKMFIRQSSEDKHWHLSAHYRSKSAAAVLRDAQIRTKAHYQAFCRKTENGLSHEHMVPGEVVYGLIVSHPNPSVEAFAEILRRTGFRATITKAEDRKLLRHTVPESFFDPKSKMHFSHLARYAAAGLESELEARPTEGWFPGEV